MPLRPIIGPRNSVQTKAPDLSSRLLPILLVVGGASEIGLVLMKRSGSESDVAYYVQVASIVLIGVGAAILAVILNASSGQFRTATAFLTIGFLLQLGYLIIRYYYQHLADPPYLPTVSVADLLFLLSYVFWVLAAVPYLSSYSSQMRRSSRALLVICGVVVIVAAYFSGSYWLRTSVDANDGSMATLVRLVHATVPFIALLPLAWVAWLYYLDNRGKKILEFAYLYFLIPVGLIALADAVMESSFIWSSGLLPGQYSDAIYLFGGSMLIAAAASIPLSALRGIGRGPSSAQTLNEPLGKSH